MWHFFTNRTRLSQQTVVDLYLLSPWNPWPRNLHCASPHSPRRPWTRLHPTRAPRCAFRYDAVTRCRFQWPIWTMESSNALARVLWLHGTLSIVLSRQTPVPTTTLKIQRDMCKSLSSDAATRPSLWLRSTAPHLSLACPPRPTCACPTISRGRKRTRAVARGFPSNILSMGASKLVSTPLSLSLSFSQNPNTEYSTEFSTDAGVRLTTLRSNLTTLTSSGRVTWARTDGSDVRFVLDSSLGLVSDLRFGNDTIVSTYSRGNRGFPEYRHRPRPAQSHPLSKINRIFNCRAVTRFVFVQDQTERDLLEPREAHAGRDALEPVRDVPGRPVVFLQRTLETFWEQTLESLQLDNARKLSLAICPNVCILASCTRGARERRRRRPHDGFNHEHVSPQNTHILGTRAYSSPLKKDICVRA